MKRAKGWMYAPDITFDKSIFDDECSNDAKEYQPVQNTTRDDPGPHWQDSSTSRDKAARSRSWCLDTHSDSEESPSLTYCCHLCPSKLNNLFHFSMHLAEHRDVFTNRLDNINPSSKHPGCRECAYLASSDADLREHRLRHESERRYVCVNCGKDFSSVQSADSHLERRHPGKRRQVLDRKLLYRDLRRRGQKAVVLDAKVVIDAEKVDEIIMERTRQNENVYIDIADDVTQMCDDVISTHHSNHECNHQMRNDLIDVNHHTNTQPPASATSSNNMEERLNDESSKYDQRKITIKIRQESKDALASSNSKQIFEMGKQLGTALMRTQLKNIHSERNKVKMVARRDRSPAGS